MYKTIQPTQKDCTFDNCIKNLQGEVEHRRMLLHDMIRHYLAAENMDMDIEKLTLWRNMIEKERIEILSLEKSIAIN